MTSIGSLDGFAGNVTGIGTFDNINRVVGSTSTTDTLTGANLSNAWTLEVGSWKLEVGSNALIVSAIETVNGGTGADTFTFTDGAMFNGTLNGGAGNDQLLFTNYSTARNVVLTSVGAVDGFNGTEASVTAFANIDILIGTSNTDTITGAALNATYELDGTNRYYFGANSISFNSFETLVGGIADDTFKFGDAYTFSGSLNGGAGNDTLDLSAFTTKRIVTLTATSATDGFDGVTASVSGGFSNINNLIGSSTITVDQLTGPDFDTNWHANAGATNSITVGANSATFSSFEHLFGGTQVDTFTVSGTGNDVALRGGAGTDRFVFNNGAAINGSIDGQGGNGNTIDYSNYTTGVLVNLSPLATLGIPQFNATGVAAVLNVQNVLGGSGDDIIVGGSDDNVITGNGGNDLLIGGPGDDVYLFADGWGANDIITEYADEGSDTIDFSAATVDLTFTIGSVTVTDAVGNRVTHADANIENLIGGAGDDTVTFGVGVTFGGSIDGKGGNDTLNFAAYTSSLNFTLTTLGSVDGFNGTVVPMRMVSQHQCDHERSASDSLTGLNAASAGTSSAQTAAHTTPLTHLTSRRLNL